MQVQCRCSVVAVKCWTLLCQVSSARPSIFVGRLALLLACCTHGWWTRVVGLSLACAAMSKAKQEMTLAGSVLSALFSVSRPWAHPPRDDHHLASSGTRPQLWGQNQRHGARPLTTREPGGDPLPSLLLIVECFTPLVIPAFTPLISRAMSCTCVELRGGEIGCGYNRCWPCRLWSSHCSAAPGLNQLFSLPRLRLYCFLSLPLPHTRILHAVFDIVAARRTTKA